MTSLLSRAARLTAGFLIALGLNAMPVQAVEGAKDSPAATPAKKKMASKHAGQAAKPQKSLQGSPNAGANPGYRPDPVSNY